MSEGKEEEGLVLSIHHPDFSSEEHVKRFIEGMAEGWARVMEEQNMRLSMIMLDAPPSAPGTTLPNERGVHLFFPYSEGGIATAEKAAAFVMMSVSMGALTYMDPVVAYHFTVHREHRAPVDSLTSVA